MENDKKRIPFGQINPKKKNAVFLAIYAKEFSPWKYFKDDISSIRCPAVIMIDRWDGRMGFPGGTVEKGEPLLEALRREIKEEIGINVKTDKVVEIASHEWEIVTHFYGLEVLEIEFMHIYYHILNSFSRSILLHAYDEGDTSHFMSETTGIKFVPIVEHGGKGINKFLENSFAGSTKEDLKIFLEEVLEYQVSQKEMKG
ncbi:MAG: NUDIX hydrolase [Sulfurospirillaceae bacterium]|nr:NUDIX hydrolase [Sulfurospirillaceae bacterium]MDD3462802.1 NUDIX hydrolase [Sulfurospirillaceae bacterium]